MFGWLASLAAVVAASGGRGQPNSPLSFTARVPTVASAAEQALYSSCR